MTMKPFPLSIVQDEPYTVDEGSLGYCCRFVTLLLSMPSLRSDENDLDMEVDFDFCEGTPSKGARPKLIIYVNHALWQIFMLKKDLNPESLR